MDSFIIGVQLLLAGVFALAGIAKLLDLPGSRRAMVDFGVPQRAARLLGTLLPPAELATAVALVVHPTFTAGAIAALALLLGFSAGIGNAMVRGRAPDCHCFGQVHSAPAGRWTLTRNAALAGLALVLVIHGSGPAVDDWVAARSSAELVAIGAALAALAMAAFSFRQWSENRELREAIARTASAGTPEPEGLPVGTVAPDFTLTDIRAGETRTLESLKARGRPIVLQFVDPGCGPCDRLLPAVARWQSALADKLTIAVVTSGSLDDGDEWKKKGISDVLLDESDDAFKAFRVRSTPTAIGLEVDGTVASAPAGGLHMPEVLIRQMIKRVAAGERVEPTAPPPPKVLQLEPRAT